MSFYSDISIGWIIPIGMLSFFGAYWYYRNQQVLTDRLRWKMGILVSLRGVALFILALLLFGWIFERKEYTEEKPTFITLIDDSQSMMNQKDSLLLETKIAELQKALAANFGDRFALKTYYVGSEVRDSFSGFSQPESNLDLGFEFIFQQYFNKNIGGICFISDGNFTTGKHPVYSAELMPLTPVFSMGIGDSTIKTDQLIQTISANNIAFYKNKFPVEIDLQAFKLGGERSKVTISKNGKTVASKEIQYNDTDLDFIHLEFELEATEIGFSHYTVEVESKRNESSYVNNRQSFFVEVIDARTKILLLAKAPHPDITALRQVVDSDEGMEMEVVLAEEWKGNLQGVSLVILHEPGNPVFQSIVSRIQSAKIPVLNMIGSRSSKNMLESLGTRVSVPGGNQLDEVQVSVNRAFDFFTLEEEMINQIEKWPPLIVRFGRYQVPGGSALLTQKIGPVKKEDPILSFQTINGVKQGAFFGEGLWKWKMSDYRQNGNTKYFETLIQKTVQYLTVKTNEEPLRIRLPKRFTVREEVQMNAEFYNEALERITRPSISFVLKNEDGKEFNYAFAKNKEDYQLSLGLLEMGRYTWEARTSYGGKNYVKTGQFVVDDFNLEKRATRSDWKVMRELATTTNGDFFTLNETDRLLKSIASRKDIATVAFENTTYKEAIDWKIWFFIVALLFSTEWFFRRFWGAY